MAKKSNWSKRELKQLREALPATWKEDLTLKHKLSAGTIENILYGTQVNDEVIFSALDLAVEHKQFIESQKQLIKQL